MAPSGEYELLVQMTLGSSSWRLIAEQNSHKSLNHIITPGLILSWNQCLNIIWTCVLNMSAILLHHGAPSHTARNTLITCSVRTSSSLSQTLWPPNRLAVKIPVNYAVWGVLQQMVYHCQSFVDDQQTSQGVGETQPIVPGQEHWRMASTWRRDAAEWQTSLNTCSNNI